MVGQCRRRGGRGLVGLGTRVGAAQTYRFWTGWGWGLNDTDIDTAIDTDTGPVKLHIGRFSLELIHLPNLKSKVCTKAQVLA